MKPFLTQDQKRQQSSN